MQKPKRQTIWGIVATLFMIAMVSHRMVKIVQKEKKKQLMAESVIPSTIWDITLPIDEFIGDLSQVGTYMVYALVKEEAQGASAMYARQLNNGMITMLDALDLGAQPMPNPQIVGLSRLGKKEFRIEQEGDRAIVAQYNIATGERGLIARLPKQCTEFKTVQRLPQNFFALEGLCYQGDSHKPFKRVMVLDLETRRLTYVSGHLAKNTRFIAFK